MIALGIAPFFACIIVIIACTLLILFLDQIPGLVFRNIGALADNLNAFVHVRMNKDIDAVRIVR